MYIAPNLNGDPLPIKLTYNEDIDLASLVVIHTIDRRVSFMTKKAGAIQEWCKIRRTLIKLHRLKMPPSSVC